MSGLAIAGLAVAVVSTAVSVGMSVDAKNKQKAAQRRAEKEADKALESARKTMEMRKLATLAINEKPFRTASENLATVAATGIEVAKGGDPRQLASVIGRTQMANIAEQEKVQMQQSARLDQLELLKAQEEQQIRDKIAGTYEAEAEGAQMAAADAAKMAAQYESQAIQGAIEGVGSIAQAGVAVGGAVQDANAGKARQAAVDVVDSSGDTSIGVADLKTRLQTTIRSKGGSVSDWQAKAKDLDNVDDILSEFYSGFGTVDDVRTSLNATQAQ